MDVYAVIPARGGSKRIKRKNIKSFAGKPLMAWSIDAAINSNCFKKIIVSTEDKEIASIAKKYGAEVPFVRPEKLSDDYATSLDVIKHAANWIQNKYKTNCLVCLIYPTAALLKKDDLEKSLKLFIHHKMKKIVFSATKYTFPVQRALFLNKFGQTKMFYPEYFNHRSQDLKDAFHDAGQFYWGTSEIWKHTFDVYEESFPYILPSWRVQDIDNPSDWERAEIIHKLME
tara:strand:- start:65 stop:751 length:687 start_codon:yes stop_codon:yes gene_type:complete